VRRGQELPVGQAWEEEDRRSFDQLDTSTAPSEQQQLAAPKSPAKRRSLDGPLPKIRRERQYDPYLWTFPRIPRRPRILLLLSTKPPNLPLLEILWNEDELLDDLPTALKGDCGSEQQQ
jgi:hypothetical protein